MTAHLPALFISHGAPTLVLEDSPSRHFIAQLGTELPRPRAIVIVSAHWETRGLVVNHKPNPETIHDFYGFPEALYQLNYPARTDAQLCARLHELFAAAGLPAQSTEQRGLDHGAWTPLMLMYPQADIPIVNLSLPHQAPAAELMRIGEALRPLRDEGVLIIASGSYTHNLRALAPEGSAPAPWALAFRDWLDQQLLNDARDTLADWLQQAPYPRHNHPSDEHIAPLWVALGAGTPGAPALKLHDDWRMGNLSMASWRFD